LVLGSKTAITSPGRRLGERGGNCGAKASVRQGARGTLASNVMMIGAYRKRSAWYHLVGQGDRECPLRGNTAHCRVAQPPIPRVSAGPRTPRHGGGVSVLPRQLHRDVLCLLSGQKTQEAAQ
jgi:hypothetical protein